MADKKVLSWEEKVAAGVPLTELEETKYAATRNTLRRIREQAEEAKFADQLANKALDPLMDVKATSKTEN
jgi:hypothetical protein